MITGMNRGKWRGAGDMVAAILKPGVTAMDRIFKTELAKCKPCHDPGGRQDRLNKAIPFGSSAKT